MKKLSTGCSRCCSALLLCSLATASWAQLAVTADARGLTVIDNCVSAGSVSFRQGVNGVVLDARDSAEVASAIVQRYPVLERDGLLPQAIALWRRPDGGWVYATLMQKAHAPHPPCYTANVVAGGMAPTAGLLRKYFAAAP